MGKSALKMSLSQAAFMSERGTFEDELRKSGSPKGISNHSSEDSHTLMLEDVGRFELKNLLMACDVARSPKANVFGVSPPVRGGRCGGAANPMTLDRNWPLHARYAVHHNLQALKERHSPLAFARDIGDPCILVASVEDDQAAVCEDVKRSATVDDAPICEPFVCQTRYF